MPEDDDITVVVQPTPIQVTVEPQNIEVTIAGTQGPQGPPGPSGSGGGQASAGETISGHTLVVMINGLLYEADPTNAAHGPLVVGVASQSGTTGALINFTQVGVVTGGSFVQGQRYFAGLNGVLSTSPQAPGAVWMKSIGLAEDSTDLIVNMGPTINL